MYMELTAMRLYSTVLPQVPYTLKEYKIYKISSLGLIKIVVKRKSLDYKLKKKRDYRTSSKIRQEVLLSGSSNSHK